MSGDRSLPARSILVSDSPPILFRSAPPAAVQTSKDIELCSLSNVFTGLQGYSKGNPTLIVLQGLAGEDDPLWGCPRRLEEIQKPMKPRSGLLGGRLGGLKWLFKVKEVLDGSKNQTA